MGSFTKSDQPLTVVRGRTASWPFTWQDPAGTPINITGFAIVASLEWRDYNSAAQVDMVNASLGKFKVSLTVPQTGNVPPGTLANLAITITDLLADPSDYVIPLTGVDV